MPGAGVKRRPAAAARLAAGCRPRDGMFPGAGAWPPACPLSAGRRAAMC